MYIIWQSSRHFFVCYDLQDVEHVIECTKIDTTQYRLLKEVHLASELSILDTQKKNEEALSFKE